MERRSQVRLTTALLLVAVFAAGFTVGIAVDRTAEADEMAEEARPEGERRRTPMYEQVEPTDEQRARIDSIVSEHREGMRALQREFRDAYDPRYQALIDSTRVAIMAVLTPEQATRYDSLLAAFDRRRAERAARDDRD